MKGRKDKDMRKGTGKNGLLQKLGSGPACMPVLWQQQQLQQQKDKAVATAL